MPNVNGGLLLDHGIRVILIVCTFFYNKPEHLLACTSYITKKMTYFFLLFLFFILEKFKQI